MWVSFLSLNICHQEYGEDMRWWWTWGRDAKQKGGSICAPILSGKALERERKNFHKQTEARASTCGGRDTASFTPEPLWTWHGIPPVVDYVRCWQEHSIQWRGVVNVLCWWDYDVDETMIASHLDAKLKCPNPEDIPSTSDAVVCRITPGQILARSQLPGNAHQHWDIAICHASDVELEKQYTATMTSSDLHLWTSRIAGCWSCEVWQENIAVVNHQLTSNKPRWTTESPLWNHHSIINCNNQLTITESSMNHQLTMD